MNVRKHPTPTDPCSHIYGTQTRQVTFDAVTEVYCLLCEAVLARVRALDLAPVRGESALYAVGKQIAAAQLPGLHATYLRFRRGRARRRALARLGLEQGPEIDLARETDRARTKTGHRRCENELCSLPRNHESYCR